MGTCIKSDIDSIQQKPSATRFALAAVAVVLILLGISIVVPRFLQAREQQVARQLVQSAGGEARDGCRFIQFKGAEITDSNLSMIRQLTKTEILELYETSITGRGLEAISAWENLKYLCIHSDLITDEALIHFQNLAKLDRLELNGSKITDDGLKQLAKLGKLRILELQCCGRISKNGIQQLQAALPDCNIRWSNDEFVPDTPASQ